MRTTRWLVAGLMLCLIGVFPQNKPRIPKVLLNPKGWSLPDLNELVRDKSVKIALPGIRSRIGAETWRLPDRSLYLIPYRPFWGKALSEEWGDLCEKVLSLVIYWSPANKILCYEYARYLIRQESKGILGVTASYICDLDGDDILEAQFDATSEGKVKRLLASILRIKLGVSEESDLVRKIVSSALLQIGK